MTTRNQRELQSPDERPVPLGEVLCTEGVAGRAARRLDPEAENAALWRLTRAFTESPDAILAETAGQLLLLLNSGSVGFSLLAHDRKRFEWAAVAGAWKPLVGGGTPREPSPFGEALKRGTPLLFRRWERHYTYLAATTPSAEEALVVPLFVGDEAVGTIWALAHDVSRSRSSAGFDGEDVRLLTSFGRFAAEARSAVRRVHEEASSRTAIELMKGVRDSSQTADRLSRRLRDSEARLVEELDSARALQEVSLRMLHHDDVSALYEEILDAAVTLMGADMASIQKVDEREEGLRLLAFRGFEPDFGENFSLCRADMRTVCTLAWETARRVVVKDTETFPYLIGTQTADDLRRAGIRSVQSTPLISRTGVVLGMISTHWRRPHAPPSRKLRLLDVLARQAGDIIERRQAEARLRRLRADAERANEARARFLATMSHEMRTPLNAIVGYHDLMKEGIAGPLTERQQAQLAGIGAGASHLLRIIEEILIFTRLEAGREEVRAEGVDLAELARAASELVAPLAARKGVSLRCVAPERIQAHTDPTKVRQVLLNLLGNAIKFTDRGEVRLEVERDPTHVLFRVRDTGIGIPADHRDRIFEPFARGPHQDRPKEGAGLGLSVSVRLARLLGGEISLESAPGEGSTFAVMLPLRVPRRRRGSAAENDPTGQRPAPGGRKRTRRTRERAEGGS